MVERPFEAGKVVVSIPTLGILGRAVHYRSPLYSGVEQLAVQRPLKPYGVGSNPTTASTKTYANLVEQRVLKTLGCGFDPRRFHPWRVIPPFIPSGSSRFSSQAGPPAFSSQAGPPAFHPKRVLPLFIPSGSSRFHPKRVLPLSSQAGPPAVLIPGGSSRRLGWVDRVARCRVGNPRPVVCRQRFESSTHRFAFRPRLLPKQGVLRPVRVPSAARHPRRRPANHRPGWSGWC